MPRKRIAPKGRRRRDTLTRPERNELLIGCFGPVRHFADEEDRRQAWQDHRAELLAGARPGRRPAAFWRYDRAHDEFPRVVRVAMIAADAAHPEGYPVKVYEDQVEALVRLGLATAADLDELRKDVAYRVDYLGADDEDTRRQTALLAALGV